MIRYHSCYPWHTGGAYRHLMDSKDERMLPYVLEFNKFDLYTKDDVGDGLGNNGVTPEQLWPYYEQLIEKYFPHTTTGSLNW